MRNLDSEMMHRPPSTGLHETRVGMSKTSAFWECFKRELEALIKKGQFASLEESRRKRTIVYEAETEDQLHEQISYTFMSVIVCY